MEEKKRNKKEMGITLTALVITVIIMLILAGVAISILRSDGGLFGRTRNAAQEYEIAIENENKVINGLINQIDKYLAGTPMGPDGGNDSDAEEDIPQITEYCYQETRYLLVDMFDKVGSSGNCVCINELEILDSNNVKINYTVVNVYDSARNGEPYYWNKSPMSGDIIWDKSNLQDGDATYSKTSTTAFIHETTSGSGDWARMLIDLGEVKQVKKINLWHGGSAETPKEFNIYTVNNKELETIYTENVKSRNNTDLELVFNKTFETDCLTSTLFDERLYIGEKPIINAKLSTESLAAAPIDIIVNATDKTSGIEVVKWLEGEAKIEDFNSSGNIINAQDNISINKNSKYTIYAKDKAGIEEVIYIDVTNIDTPPVIVLNGIDNTVVVKGNEYVDSGATVQDDRSTDFTISVNGTVDTSTLGEYTLTYTSSPDERGNVAEPVTKTVHVINSAHFIMEVYDHLGSNYAVINELEFVRHTGSNSSYKLVNVYDSVRKGQPFYWDKSPLSGDVIWDKTNLSDGAIATGSSNSTARVNTTAFLYDSSANSGSWARVLVNLSSSDIQKTRIAIGMSHANCTPKKVMIYAFENYDSTTAYNTNVKVRGEEGLIKLKEFTFTSQVKTPTWYEIIY